MFFIRVLGLSKPRILSPLAGITIPPFRKLCAEAGADITVSEMTSAKALLYSRERALIRIQRTPSEKKFGIQLLTNDTSDLEQAIDVLERKKLADYIELNLGSPSLSIFCSCSFNAVNITSATLSVTCVHISIILLYLSPSVILANL